MTIIEHYLKKLYNLEKYPSIIKELENYLIQNNYEIDLSKMIKPKDNNIYLISKDKEAVIRIVNFGNNEEIIINESGIVQDNNSVYYGYDMNKETNININSGNMCIITNYFDKNNLFNKKGYTANIYYLENKLNLELVYPLYEQENLEDINNILEEIKDNHLLLTIMGKLINQGLSKYQVKTKRKESYILTL